MDWRVCMILHTKNSGISLIHGILFIAEKVKERKRLVQRYGYQGAGIINIQWIYPPLNGPISQPTHWLGYGSPQRLRQWKLQLTSNDHPWTLINSPHPLTTPDNYPTETHPKRQPPMFKWTPKSTPHWTPNVLPNILPNKSSTTKPQPPLMNPYPPQKKITIDNPPNSQFVNNHSLSQ